MSEANPRDAQPWEHEVAVQRLKEEIGTLHKEQNDHLKRATFVGMTTEEAKDYDSRQVKLMKLWQRLVLRLENAE